jgi:hypothetical protein
MLLEPGFIGEDAMERYLFFRGVGRRDFRDLPNWPEPLDWAQKWLILDIVTMEWLYATCTPEPWAVWSFGVNVLYKVKSGGRGVRGLRLEFANVDLPFSRMITEDDRGYIF